MVTKCIIDEGNLKGSLEQAFSIVNEQLEAVSYQVTYDKERELLPKSPIFLVIKYLEGEAEPIGITHFVHLTHDMEDAKFSEVARTVEELAGSIFKALKIHEDAKKQKGVLITDRGTPFFTKGHEITIDAGILHIKGVQIRYEEQPLEAKRLTGEEGLTFVRLDNGDFTVENPVDRRKGKGIFFAMPSGKIYRK